MKKKIVITYSTTIWFKDVNALWLAIIVNLDKNEKEKCVHIMVSNENYNLLAFVMGNVYHKWLHKMWHLVQLELELYIIITND
jgi:hypothetical protein